METMPGTPVDPVATLECDPWDVSEGGGVVRTEAEWVAFWQANCGTNEESRDARPQVDFSRHAVVFYFWGERGGADSVALTGLADQTGHVVASVVRTSSPQCGPDIQWFPGFVVTVPRFESTLEFRFDDRVKDC